MKLLFWFNLPPSELVGMVRRLIVPDDFANDASKIFGDRVAAVSQLEETQ